jgi:hypothetical protein
MPIYGDGGGPVEDATYKEWDSGAWEILKPLMAALNQAEKLTLPTPMAVVAMSDQFRSVARDANRWNRTHPCPVPELGFDFTRMVRSVIALADYLEGQARSPSDWPALSREVTGVHALLMQVMGLMSDQAG